MADSTKAQIGSKTVLSYWNAGTPPAYVPIANVAQFGEVGADKPEVDSTDLDSSGVERIGGLTDGKEITITCQANTITVPLIKQLYDDAQTITLKVQFPTPLAMTYFFGFIPLGFSLGTITPSGIVQVAMRGRISGDITETDPEV